MPKTRRLSLLRVACRLRDFYRSRRDAMQEALEGHLRDVADWEKPHGGLFFWVRLKRECDTHGVLIESLDRNVAFMPGEPFFANPLRRGTWMRLSFSHATLEQIDRGMAILGEVIRHHRTSSPAQHPASPLMAGGGPVNGDG